jgi:hypothetical protein
LKPAKYAKRVEGAGCIAGEGALVELFRIVVEERGERPGSILALTSVLPQVKIKSDDSVPAVQLIP